MTGLASLPPFRHDILPPGYIRLVLIDPGLQEDPIRCTLVAKHISQCGLPYNALSYTWGDATKTGLLEIMRFGDVAFSSLIVTQSLITAL